MCNYQRIKYACGHLAGEGDHEDDYKFEGCFSPTPSGLAEEPAEPDEARPSCTLITFNGIHSYSGFCLKCMPALAPWVNPSWTMPYLQLSNGAADQNGARQQGSLNGPEMPGILTQVLKKKITKLPAAQKDTAVPVQISPIARRDMLVAEADARKRKSETPASPEEIIRSKSPRVGPTSAVHQQPQTQQLLAPVPPPPMPPPVPVLKAAPGKDKEPPKPRPAVNVIERDVTNGLLMYKPAVHNQWMEWWRGTEGYRQCIDGAALGDKLLTAEGWDTTAPVLHGRNYWKWFEAGADDYGVPRLRCKVCGKSIAHPFASGAGNLGGMRQHLDGVACGREQERMGLGDVLRRKDGAADEDAPDVDMAERGQGG